MPADYVNGLAEKSTNTEEILTDTPTNQFIRRHFHQRSLRARVILAQLPFSLTVALAVVLIAVMRPSLFTEPQVIVALWMNVALLAACVFVPWDKLRPGAYLIIPYLDFVAVAFFREGLQTLLSSVGLLALFPVFWLCSSGFAPKTAVISSTLASLLIIWNPVFQAAGPVRIEELARPLLFPFMMMAFAIAVTVFTASMDGQRDTLIAKDAQLRAALKESQHRERLLETIVDTVGVGVVAVDVDGNDQLMNSTQLGIHALAQPRDIVDAQESELLVYGHNRNPLAAEARPVRRAILGQTFTNYQIWVGEGEEARALSTTARPILDNDGSFDGAVVAFHDVTDMVNALAAKDDFVANVSHEFRTPLTAIVSYLDLALETPELQPEPVIRYLNVAARNAERLNGLVSDLLTTRAISVKQTTTDVTELLEQSLYSAAPAAEANNVTVNFQPQQQLLARIDPVRISQVLDNLISNAVKYSPDGGTLTARVWCDGADLHCEVTDTGLGMSLADQAGVFQKFFRAGSARERGIPGIGLGLMISKSIIEGHGGTLTIASEPGAGTTMSFLIPGCVVSTERAFDDHQTVRS